MRRVVDDDRSSWTVAGTIGVVAGRIAPMLGVFPCHHRRRGDSGSYLGDSYRRLSEMTVLSAQIAKIGIHTHIRAQAWTTVPAFWWQSSSLRYSASPVRRFTTRSPRRSAREARPDLLDLTVNLLPLVFLVSVDPKGTCVSGAVGVRRCSPACRPRSSSATVVNGFVGKIDGSHNPLAG